MKLVTAWGLGDIYLKACLKSFKMKTLRLNEKVQISIRSYHNDIKFKRMCWNLIKIVKFWLAFFDSEHKKSKVQLGP